MGDDLLSIRETATCCTAEFEELATIIMSERDLVMPETPEEAKLVYLEIKDAINNI